MRNNKHNYRETTNTSPKGGEFRGSSEFDHIQPIQAQHLEVKVYGSYDKAMRTFRSLVQKERVLSSYKERQAYEKPSDKKRRKRNERSRKLLELEMRDNPNSKSKKKDYEQEVE